jgi:hypothetical protein
MPRRTSVSAMAGGVGQWAVGGNEERKILIGSTIVLLRIFNAGPTNAGDQGVLTVMDGGGKVLVKIPVGNSSDVEGKTIIIKGFNISGWYDRA